MSSPLDAVLRQIRDLVGAPLSVQQRRVGWNGEGIRRARKQCKMTQADLAKKAGISQSHLSRVERCQESLSVEALVSVSKALSTTLDALIAP